jgi:ribonuclease E
MYSTTLMNVNMNRKILVDAARLAEIRVVTVADGKITTFDYENKSQLQLKGNIYLGRITRIEPSLQAAFVDYGAEKQGFLSFSEIHIDYLRMSDADKQRFLEKSRGERSTTDLEHSTAWNNEGERGYSYERSTIHEQVQDFIKRDQKLIVQVVKDQRGNKGVTFSTYISLVGRYCVLLPNTEYQSGISRRISNSTSRRALRTVLDDLSVPTGMSAIIRSAGLKRNAAEVKGDYNHLIHLWQEIQVKVKVTAETDVKPSLIYEGNSLIRRTILDLFDNSISKMVISGREAHKTAKEIVKSYAPNFVSQVKRYNGKVPIFTQYAIEEQVAALYSNRAELTSGGYLVINRTEALIAIDINSGRMTKEQNVEETALKTNLEATEEIARQICLRGLSGLIVIDFIGMREYKNRYAVEDALRNAVQLDKAKIQLGRIDSLGLLVMSRQRMGPSLFEINSRLCSICEGRGILHTTESVADTIFRALEGSIALKKSTTTKFDVFTNQDLAVFLLNNMRPDIFALEKKYNICVAVFIDLSLGAEEFRITPQEEERDNCNDNVLDGMGGANLERSEIDFHILTKRWIRGLLG